MKIMMVLVAMMMMMMMMRFFDVDVGDDIGDVLDGSRSGG